MEEFNLFDMLRTITQHIQNNVGEVFCHTSSDMMGGKIRSGAPSSRISIMLYQKRLTGVFVGAVFQLLTCSFIGHCLQMWTTRIILLHNLTS